MIKRYARIATFYLCISCPEEAWPAISAPGGSQPSLHQMERMRLCENFSSSFFWETMGSLSLSPAKPTVHQPIERMESLLDGPNGLKYLNCEVRKTSIQISTQTLRKLVKLSVLSSCLKQD